MNSNKLGKMSKLILTQVSEISKGIKQNFFTENTQCHETATVCTKHNHEIQDPIENEKKSFT